MTDQPTLPADLAHELRTPLAALLGYADAMSSETFGPLSEHYRQSARTIQAAAEHLLALIDRASPGAAPMSLERFDARQVITEAFELYRLPMRRAGLTATIEMPDQQIDVLADRRALSQILINLLSNAAKVTPRGGRVELYVERRRYDLRLSLGNGQTPGGHLTMRPPYQGPGRGLRLIEALCEQLDGGFALYDSACGGVEASVVLNILAEI